MMERWRVRAENPCTARSRALPTEGQLTPRLCGHSPARQAMRGGREPAGAYRGHARLHHARTGSPAEARAACAWMPWLLPGSTRTTYRRSSQGSWAPSPSRPVASTTPSGGSPGRSRAHRRLRVARANLLVNRSLVIMRGADWPRRGRRRGAPRRSTPRADGRSTQAQSRHNLGYIDLLARRPGQPPYGDASARPPLVDVSPCSRRSAISTAPRCSATPGSRARPRAILAGAATAFGRHANAPGARPRRSTTSRGRSSPTIPCERAASRPRRRAASALLGNEAWAAAGRGARLRARAQRRAGHRASAVRCPVRGASPRRRGRRGRASASSATASAARRRRCGWRTSCGAHAGTGDATAPARASGFRRPRRWRCSCSPTRCAPRAPPREARRRGPPRTRRRGSTSSRLAAARSAASTCRPRRHARHGLIRVGLGLRRALGAPRRGLRVVGAGAASEPCRSSRCGRRPTGGWPTTSPSCGCCAPRTDRATGSPTRAPPSCGNAMRERQWSAHRVGRGPATRASLDEVAGGARRRDRAARVRLSRRRAGRASSSSGDRATLHRPPRLAGGARRAARACARISTWRHRSARAAWPRSCGAALDDRLASLSRELCSTAPSRWPARGVVITAPGVLGRHPLGDAPGAARTRFTLAASASRWVRLRRRRGAARARRVSPPDPRVARATRRSRPRPRRGRTADGRPGGDVDGRHVADLAARCRRAPRRRARPARGRQPAVLGTRARRRRPVRLRHRPHAAVPATVVLSACEVGPLVGAVG